MQLQATYDELNGIISEKTDLKGVFENVAVNSLSFTEDVVCLDASLK